MSTPDKYPEWKHHKINTFYQLDEDVMKDVFVDNTNFDGMCYYDTKTKLVKYFSDGDHYMDLVRYCEPLGLYSQGLDYIDDSSIYCLLSISRSRTKWITKLNLKLRKRSEYVTMVVDTGATFSMMSLHRLSMILKVPQDVIKKLLVTKSNKASVKTAGSILEYYAVHLDSIICGKSVKLRVYVDINNQLPYSLLGFDVVQALTAVCSPKHEPLISGFSVETYNQYCKDNPEVHCNIIDLMNFFHEK